jgi:hypothetical protein
MRSQIGFMAKSISQLVLWRSLAVIFAGIAITVGLYKEDNASTAVNTPVSNPPQKGTPSQPLSRRPVGADALPPPLVNERKVLPVDEDSQAAFFQRSQRELRQPINYRRIRQQEVQNLFGEWIKFLSISPESKTELKRLLVERAHRVSDVNAVIAQQGIKDPSVAKRLIADDVKDLDSRVADLVGSTNVADFQGLLAARNEIGMYRIQQKPDFEFADMPLTTAQTLQLLNVQKQAREAARDGPQTDRTDVNAEGLRATDAAIVQQVSQSLSPAQLSILKDYYRARYEMEKDPPMIKGR